ncbi:MAG: LCP family protein [Coriobacteriales bacterium]|nr:LCP family protein [Coriobacteriales bacterium]
MTLGVLLIAAVVAILIFAATINEKLGTDLEGNRGDFDSGAYGRALVAPEKPEDPFWVLLMGTDNREGLEVPRTDTIILVRVDQANKAMSMISIPRDTFTRIEGIGEERINTVYTYAELEEPGSGPAATVKAISQFAGVNIAYFAQVDFTGLVQLFDGLGGVEVDVPLDIIGDYDAGGLDIYAGPQTLDGAHALVFCRSREFYNGDYQRQADQRIFLQALAAKVLASNPATIASTISTMADMTYTNMDIAKIIKVAQGMAGMQESDIRTYTVPSTPDDIGGVSYVVADPIAWEELIEAIETGEYPERQDEEIAGVVPDAYIAKSTGQQGANGQGATSSVDPSDYSVEVRNGNGVVGSAQSVSDDLAQAGYQQGDVGDAPNSEYKTTLIIYRNETDKAVANDIKQRLGYGTATASQGGYVFNGDILIIVGEDYPQAE